jgi:M3 family oligoendopeptidase
MQNIKNIEIPQVTKEAIEADFTQFEKELKAVASEKELIKLYQKVLDYCDTFNSNFSILSYRYNGNLKNETYDKAYTYYLDSYPTLKSGFLKIQSNVKKSPFFDALSNLIGNNGFEELKRSREMSKEAQEIFEQIAKIEKEYDSKIGIAQVIWEGETVSLSAIYKYFMDQDRATRKKAYDTIGTYFLEQESELTKIFIELVKLRNAYARELGYNNYHEYSFDLYCRIGYGAKEIDGFRNQVSKDFLGIYLTIKELRKKNLKLEHLSYYDNINFIDGEAELKHKDIQKNISLFIELLKPFSSKWTDILNEMQDKGAIDYDIRDNKIYGGYCTYAKSYNLPIIYSGLTVNNLNDIRVLSHEIGHALQMSITNSHTKYQEACLDTVEIFSHSMEMSIYPYLDLFFEGNHIRKYQLKNFIGHLNMLFDCSIDDEFQEITYLNEEKLSSAFICNTYKKLEEKYQFVNNHEPDLFYTQGKKWLSNGHLFKYPFYMIDYALAIIVALQLYQQSLTNSEIYVQNFESLSKNIGNLSQKNISEYSSCFSAFDFDQFKKLAQFIEETLEQIKLT